MATEMPVILGIDAAWTEQDARQDAGTRAGTRARAERFLSEREFLDQNRVLHPAG